jgi:hypothetical protein
MNTVEYWRWRYRNYQPGQICRTIFGCTAEEATKLYPGAARIEGTMVLREMDDDRPPVTSKPRKFLATANA